MSAVDSGEVAARERLRLVVLGLSISSAWGNGHATTYRSLIRGLGELGHDVVFLERDVPWYAANRDDPAPLGCRLEFYDGLPDLERFTELVRDADAVMVGSYVPDGIQVLEWAREVRKGALLFYDIDTPVTLERLKRGEPTYIAKESIPSLDAYLSFTGGPALDTITRVLGGKCALPLYCSANAETYAPVTEAPHRDLGYLGTYSIDRQPALEELLNESARRYSKGRFVVAGSCYPPTQWPENVERIEHVSPREHPAFYGSLRFALNLTRAEMRSAGYSPSVRVFEAAACGVPILSDSWPGIEQFFEPEREILIVESSAEVVRLLQDLPERERRSIGERARARFLREHTGLHRARTFEAYLFKLRRKLGKESDSSGANSRAVLASGRR